MTTMTTTFRYDAKGTIYERKELISWTSLKLRKFCSAKDTVNRSRRQATDWEKIFTKDT